MASTVTNPIKIASLASNIGFISEKDKTYTLTDHIFYLIKASANSDPKTKSKIENHIVKLGKKAVPALVSALAETTGTTRGMVAMALIRIGSPSIAALNEIAFDNPEMSWITDYLIQEIRGTGLSLAENRSEKPETATRALSA